MVTVSRRTSDAPERLVAAARALLAERRPADITVRTVAERAGVQHSQITRYFGSREALMAVAVADLLAAIAADIDAAADLDAALTVTIDHFLASPTRSGSVAILVFQTNGRPTDGVLATNADADRYPIAESLERALRSAGIAAAAARPTAVSVIATIAGWSAAEPWWIRMAHCREEPDASRRILAGAVRAIIDAAERT